MVQYIYIYKCIHIYIYTTVVYISSFIPSRNIHLINVTVTNSPGSMDVMLGPSSSDFRLAAAQVADEFQRPLVSWSLPEIMGVSFVRPAQSTAPVQSGDVLEMYWVYNG